MMATSSPKKPNTGHAPMTMKLTPAMKLTPPTNAISSTKPRPLSER
jgi:hypothetical protein